MSDELRVKKHVTAYLASLIVVLVALLASFAIIVSNTQGKTKPEEERRVVYDRPSHKVYQIDTVCLTCGGNAISDGINVVCLNPSCPVYGMVIEVFIDE